MNSQSPLILAIESSCDDTSAAVLAGRVVRSNIIATQKIHEQYGGVIPELASRSHQKNIVPVIDKALKSASVNLTDIDAIAFTQGPGLPGSLVVGNAFAKSLSLSLNRPLIAVNHMRAHVLAHFIDGVHERPPTFPFLCLTVSGGHSQITKVTEDLQFEVLASTLDDAAGEAFDKIGKLLGLPYPAGPQIDRLSAEGDASRFDFPKSRMSGYDYSFSGLKTAVLYFLRKELERNGDFIEQNRNDLAASVQRVIVEMLMSNLEKVAADTGINQIALAGGVSANTALRLALQNIAEQNDWETFVPPIEYCTDNAAMIGIAGYFQYQSGDLSDLSTVSSARLKLL